MEFFKKIAPQIPRGQLSCVFEKKDFTRYKRFVFNHLKVNKISSPDFMSFAGKDLPNKYVTGSGLPVLPGRFAATRTWKKFYRIATTSFSRISFP